MGPALLVALVLAAMALLLLPPHRRLHPLAVRVPALALLAYLATFHLAHRNCACPPLISALLRLLADPLVRRHRYRAAVPLLRAALSWEGLWGARSLAATEELAAVLTAARLPVPPALLRVAADLRAAPMLARIDAWLGSPL